MELKKPCAEGKADVPGTSPQAVEHGPVKPPQKFTGIYSQSGFDMMGILVSGPTRPVLG